MSFKNKLKTEHVGAKNGGGAFWGTREYAKNISRKVRRQRDKRESSVASLGGELFDSVGDTVNLMIMLDALDELLKAIDDISN